MCPVRVHKWKDIGEREKEHMWRAVMDVFSNENMEAYGENVLNHMNELWINWRVDLLRYNVTKKKRTLQQALKYVPNGLEKDEWEWLIKEIYLVDKFKKVSVRNSGKRKGYRKELLHRTGSKPYSQVAWEMGAKHGAEPSLLDMYWETHKKGRNSRYHGKGTIFFPLAGIQVKISGSSCWLWRRNQAKRCKRTTL